MHREWELAGHIAFHRNDCAQPRGLSFPDSRIIVVISSFADRKLCRASLHVSLRAIVFHATLLRAIASLITGSEREFLGESFISVDTDDVLSTTSSHLHARRFR